MLVRCAIMGRGVCVLLSEKRNVSAVCAEKLSYVPVAWPCTAEHTAVINCTRVNNVDRRLLRRGI